MKSYIDIHCHPSLKPYSKSFKSKALRGKHSLSPNERHSIWYQKRPNDLHVISAGDNNSLISDSMVVYNGDVKTSIDLTPDQYTISGKGWGHGLGMSQWGAKMMAELGFTFEEILTHYYTGTHIE